jgi:hypothetical protein
VVKKDQRAFYDIDEFPEFLCLSGQYAMILEELKQNDYWMNWGSDDYDPSGHCQFLEGNWTVCPVYFGHFSPLTLIVPGVDYCDMAKLADSLPSKFPKTTEMLGKIHSINFAAFSRLHPKSSLAPHSHKNPWSLIFHLGLIIPAGKSCGISVNNEIRHWTKSGDAIIFDDTLVHSAWNQSDEERTILYIDFRKSE